MVCVLLSWGQDQNQEAEDDEIDDPSDFADCI